MAKGNILTAIQLTGDFNGYPNSVPWGGGADTSIFVSYVSTTVPNYYVNQHEVIPGTLRN
jgi:hypothetical protein